jgi:RAD50-interacting protein 1
MAEVQARVEDYLDDQVQTAADLESINALLARVQEQQALLQAQVSIGPPFWRQLAYTLKLEVAHATRVEAEKDAHEQATALSQRGLEFLRLQQDLDGRLASVTDSHTSDDAVTKFESHMVKVRRLEIATGYLETLQEIEKTRKNVVDQLQQTPRLALQSYSRLRNLSHALIQAQPDVEGAAPHLIDWVTTKTDDVETELRTALSKDFKSTLDTMHWPQKDLNLSGDILSVWTETRTSPQV